jgi:hypothetical protein
VIVDGRLPGGRWAPGRSGNPNGRPVSARQTIRGLQQSLEEAVRRKMDSRRIANVIDSLITAAEGGSTSAAKVLLPYVLAKPSDSEEADRGTGGIVIRIENATFRAQQQQTDDLDNKNGVINGEFQHV